MIDTVASRYAQALFQVGTESSNTDELYEELKVVVDILNQNQEFFGILKSPLIGKGEKKTLLSNVFAENLSNETFNFLKILIDKNRISCINQIEDIYKKLLNEKNNIIEGTVISAISLNENEMKDLEIKLSQKYSKTVKLKNEIDKSILGGLLVRLGNEEIDGTVKNRLTKMKEQLSQVIS